MFGDFNFDRMNETDVRENIVAPLIRELGYKHSSANAVITEQILRYPKAYLGRKKDGDRDIRGKADYILEAAGRYRWVTEAKAPNAPISPDEIDQAYSYAIHPEVKAIYYLLTNGREFQLFRTVDAPTTGPFLTFDYEKLAENFQALKNLLSPDEIARAFAAVTLDTGKPLGPGLRSFAKVVNGSATYTQVVPDIPGHSIIGMRNFIREGALERTEDAKMVAYLKFGSSHQQLDDILRAWKLEVFEISSDAASLSSDASQPTRFSSELGWTIPKGSPLFDPSSGRTIPSPFQITVNTRTSAAGVLAGSRFSGEFSVVMKLQFPSPVAFPAVQMLGTFEMQVS